MRTLYRNAHIVDGTGSDGYPGWLLTDGPTTAAVEPEGTPVPTGIGRTIDLQGAALAPGCIDTHSHSDFALLQTPDLPAKVRQGITTEILGQDGLGLAPLPAQYADTWRKHLSGLSGDHADVAWDWGDFASYMERLRTGGVGPNAGSLVGHGNVRMEAMGLDARPATDDELATMAGILERELCAGGMGLSTGLVYTPCAYADARELHALCAVAARHAKPLVIHQRSESGDIIASMHEVLDVARATGVHVHFSHFKVCGLKYGHLLDDALALLDAAAAEGLSVSLDQYPYTAGSTMLSVILPPWAHAGGTTELLSRLQCDETRQRMAQDIQAGLSGWDNFIDFAGEENIYITHVATEATEWAVGKNLVELGEMTSCTPLDAACKLLVENTGGVSIVDFYGTEEHIEAILARPETNVCTDGLLFGTPHPRAYGSFPRVLGRMVRERGVLSLAQAVHKCSGRAAAVFGLTDRGVLAPGMAADLFAFDPDTIDDVATYTEPRQYPTGVRLVCVNGVIEYDARSQVGQHNHRAGRILLQEGPCD